MLSDTSNAVPHVVELPEGAVAPRRRVVDVRAASMTEALQLARDLAAASSPEEAVHATVDFCAKALTAPAAVWLADDGAGVRRLVGIWGGGRDGVIALMDTVATLRLEGYRAGDDVPELERFRESFGLDRATVVPAGPATIIVGDPGTAHEAFLDAVGGLLAEALEQLADRGPRRRELDLGLALAAHELRAPLVAARAALEGAVSDDGLVRPDGQGLLRRAAIELDALSRKVDGLLRWSVGADGSDLEPCDLVPIAYRAIGTLVLETETDRITLTAPDRLEVLATPAHLQIAIENLVRNAVAYSPPGSAVVVEVAADGPCASIAVRDSGPGIASRERDTVFEGLARVTNGRPRGHGLGLFIAKRIVDAHQGDLVYEPGPDGRGSIFRVRLPRVGGDGGRSSR